MGKRTPYVDPELTFAPQINSSSRRLASQRLESLESLRKVPRTAPLPHFMSDTFAKKRYEPIAPIKTGHIPIMTMAAPSTKTPVKFKVKEPELTFSPKLNHTSLKIAREKGPQLRANIMHRAAAVTARLVEENTFTFKPKVSSHSVKIAESLGSDFMSRQQQHLEKQKRYVSHLNVIFIQL